MCWSILAVGIITLDATRAVPDSIAGAGSSREFSEGVLLTHNCAFELHAGRLCVINLPEDLKGNPVPLQLLF